MNKTKYLKALAAIIVGSGLSAIAQAQVATGPWSSWSPSSALQIKGCASISGNTFKISCSDQNENRAERSYANFGTGSKQWQGSCTVSSLVNDKICVHQCFSTGPFAIVSVKKPGSIYEVETQQTIGSWSIGNSFRLNSVCYTGTDKVVIYVNGSQKLTITGGGGTYHFKYGAYRSDGGRGPATINYSGVQLWQK